MFHRPGGLLIGSELLLEEVRESTQNIVWFLRAPRALLGALVEVALTLPSVGIQVFTKNPLAGPYVLDTSPGASPSVVLVMLLGVSLPVPGHLPVSASALAGALVSILLVYLLARTRNTVTPTRLILVEVMVSAVFQASTSYIVYTALDDAAAREATLWMLEGLGSAKWVDMPLLVGLVPPVLLPTLTLAKPLSAMMMGDSSVVILGVSLTVVRNALTGVAALLTASSVAVNDCTGSIGLVIPYLIRLVVELDHRKLVPLAALFRIISLIWVDVRAQIIKPLVEIPVGILTTSLGVPLFLWTIKVRRYEFQ